MLTFHALAMKLKNKLQTEKLQVNIHPARQRSPAETQTASSFLAPLGLNACLKGRVKGA
jgi:hypothetical protein